MKLSNDMKQWLIQQKKYHEEQLVSHTRQRQSKIRIMKEKGAEAKKYTRAIKKISSILSDIDKVIAENNWEV